MERALVRKGGRTPSPFRVDLRVTPGNAQEFDLWRSGMDPLFKLDVPDAEARASFGANLTAYQFADVAIVSGRSSAATFQRTWPLIARSGLDYISLVVYAEGGCALDARGEAADVRPGDVCFLDLSRPTNLRAPGYESLTLILPRAALESHLADLDDLHGRILRKSEPLNAMLVGHLRTLFAEAPRLRAADGRMAANGTAALIAAFAGASESGRNLIARSNSGMTFYSFRRFIEMNLQHFDLGPDLMCRQLGVSRSALYRAFESIGGVTQYILHRRLAGAYRLIIDPTHAHQRVGVLAARYGFSNVAVFNRAFRRTYGMSPTQLRDAIRRDEIPGVLFSGENGFGTLGRWLLGLDGPDG
jgi:AraC-like DNA-binding protein